MVILELLQDETLKQQMNSFLLSTQSQNEIANLDNKVNVRYLPFDVCVLELFALWYIYYIYTGEIFCHQYSNPARSSNILS